MGNVMNRGLVSVLFLSLTSPAALAEGPAAPRGHPVIFGTEHAARLRCPEDNIVWASTSARTLYLPGDKHYGHTRGGFVCESEARGKGYRGPTSRG
jgi:hypothetical protein